MNEQPIHLHASLQEIWRRRLLVISVAVLCGLAGLVFGLLRPAQETAVALVLLPPGTAANSSDSGNSGNSGVAANTINTDAVIARSTPVLTLAGAKVSPPLSPLGIRQRVTVTPLSGQILQIEARAPESLYAVELANAVAASYVRYAGQLATSAAEPQLAALKQQSAQLTKQLNDLQTQVSAVSGRLASEASASSAGLQDANLLASLESQQDQIALELNSVTGQISTTKLSTGSTADSTRVLQSADSAPADAYGPPLQAGLIGAVLGLLGGVVFVLVRLQRHRRLRLRDEIARAAGAPVIASIEAPHCTTPAAWRHLLDSPPRATAEWALRNVLSTLLNGETRRTGVRVISFAGDSAALTTGPRLALHAAASGTTTSLVPLEPQMSDDRSLQSLRAAFTGAEPIARGLPITLGIDDTCDETPEFLVSIVIFDDGVTTLAPSNTLNLLSISPDYVTVDQLAQLALQAADGESTLDAVVVVNPDPTDTTSGLIADDALRILSSETPTGARDNDLLRLKALTRDVKGSSDRMSSQERQ